MACFRHPVPEPEPRGERYQLEYDRTGDETNNRGGARGSRAAHRPDYPPSQ